MTVVIRPEQYDDIAHIRRVTALAFGGESEARLVDELRADGDLAVSLVAEVRGVTVGHIGLSAMRSPLGALGLAPLSVAPDMQGRGIGSALAKSAISEAKANGASSIFVLGDAAYYARFGFSAAAARDFPGVYSGVHFMALHLTVRGALPGPAVHARAFDQLT